jgi:hypothetical protein
MNNVFNRETNPWIRPWNQEKFDDLYNRDERFFAIIIKGLLSWLNRNIVLYNKSVNHFIFNTGSSYLYMESNGYEYNLSETSGEDTMYMKLPRCLIELSDINIPMEELSSPFARGYYERHNGNMISGYNAEIRRLPIELTINMKYYLSNFNETLILLQELIDKLVFQKYFNVTYLGEVLQCSIEFPTDMNPEINKIDMSSPEPNQRNLTLNIKICTNYPLIDVRTEIPTDKVISQFDYNMNLTLKDVKSDEIAKGDAISTDDGFNEFADGLIKEKEEIVFNNENNAINIENIDDPFIKKFDINNDGIIGINDLIQRFDINNDGIIYEHELTNILEKMKYGMYSEDADYTETCHYKIDYKDVYYAIKLINMQENISAHYDKFTNKIYVTHNDTGNTEDIDLIKYKIIN